MRRGIYFGIALLVLPKAVLASCPVGAISAADQITGHVNAAYSLVQTHCVPTDEPLACSVVCFTATRITSFQETRRWLTAGESAIHGLSARGRVQIDYLHMTDRGLLEQQLTLRIPTQRAFDAQSPAQIADRAEQSATVWDRFTLQPLPPLRTPDMR